MSFNENKIFEDPNKALLKVAEIGQEIISSLSVSEINERVYASLNSLMDATSFGIGIYNAEENCVQFVGYIEKGKKIPTGNYYLTDDSRFAVLCFKEQKEIFTNDFRKDYEKFFPGKTLPPPIAGEQVESIIYYPLSTANKHIGVITVQSFKKNAYTEYHLDVIRNLGIYVVTALENARLYENMEAAVKTRTLEIEHTYHNIKLLSQIGQQISSCLTVEKIIDTSYEKINELMDASSFWIGIYNKEEQRLNYPMGKERGKNVGSAFYDLNEDDRLPVWSFKNQKEVFVNDYLLEYNNFIPGHKPPLPIAGDMPVSSIWVPLVSKDGSTIGIITIQSFEKNSYTEHDVDIIKNLAIYVTSAMENARLYENMENEVKLRTLEIEKSYQNTKLLSEIGREITASLSVGEINERVYASLNSLMDATSFGIGIYNAEENCVQFVGYIEKGKKIPTGNYYLTDDSRFAVLCFKEQKEIFTNDLRKDYEKFFPGKTLPPPIAGEHVESIIYYPLSTANKHIGVVTVQSFKKNAYTEYHLDIIRNLGIYIVTALENARLYENMEAEVKIRTREIEIQKHLIEEKHKEITDSINYAERIQRSFLATKELLDENLNDYFVFFKPKSVVSGDFYRASKLSNGNFAMLTADSTGHGVPGAIMSLLNITSLQEAVKEGLVEPADILNRTRTLIIETLKKDGSVEGGKDGMDGSLVSFDFENNKFTYSAANNPVWVIRDRILIELKPDKMPIGKHEKDSEPFTQKEFSLLKNDVVYTLTDGFSDQFGGPKGKKFMHKQLKELLISISHDPMEMQKQILDSTFNAWKGGLEQVDDVCLIGVRL